MKNRATSLRKEIPRHPARTSLSLMRITALCFSIAMLASGCNSDDTEAFPIDGTWTGAVAEAEAEFLLLLIRNIFIES